MSEENKNLEENALEDTQAEQVSGGKKNDMKPDKKEKEKNNQNKLGIGIVLDV